MIKTNDGAHLNGPNFLRLPSAFPIFVMQFMKILSFFLSFILSDRDCCMFISPRIFAGKRRYVFTPSYLCIFLYFQVLRVGA